MSHDDLTWQHLSSRYEEAGLMLFEKRIDTLRNPRNGRTFDRLVWSPWTGSTWWRWTLKADH